LNFSINALQTATGAHYIPKWTELGSSVFVVAVAVIAFRYAVIYLDILRKKQSTPNGFQRWIANGGLTAKA
jgi:hypothetical protein